VIEDSRGILVLRFLGFHFFHCSFSKEEGITCRSISSVLFKKNEQDMDSPERQKNKKTQPKRSTSRSRRREIEQKSQKHGSGTTDKKRRHHESTTTRRRVEFINEKKALVKASFFRIHSGSYPLTVLISVCLIKEDLFHYVCQSCLDHTRVNVSHDSTHHGSIFMFIDER
jgi:hypothetical protein